VLFIGRRCGFQPVRLLVDQDSIDGYREERMPCRAVNPQHSHQIPLKAAAQSRRVSSQNIVFRPWMDDPRAANFCSGVIDPVTSAALTSCAHADHGRGEDTGAQHPRQTETALS
jgi:hypothetical protein